MNPKKAIEHFKWKFGQKGKMTDRDKEALNCLIQYYNTKEEQKLHDYTMFGKLYIVLLRALIKHYKCSVMDKSPHQSMDRILAKPIGQHAEEFTQFLNDQEIYTIFDMAGTGDFDHVHISHLEGIYIDNGVPESEWRPKIDAVLKKRKERRDRLDKILEEHPDVRDMMYKGKNVWSVDDVIDILNGSISKLIFDHDNE